MRSSSCGTGPRGRVYEHEVETPWKAAYSITYIDLISGLRTIRQHNGAGAYAYL